MAYPGFIGNDLPNLLDSFARPNVADTLGPNWQQGVMGRNSNLGINGNTCVTTSSSSAAWLPWTPSTHFAVAYTVAFLADPGSGDNLGFFFVCSNPTPFVNPESGYSIEINNGNPTTRLDLIRWVASSGTFLNEVDMGIKVLNGDLIGVDFAWNPGVPSITLAYYLKRGGANWVSASSDSDTVAPVGGSYYPGIRNKYAGDQIADFRAEQIGPEAPVVTPPVFYQSRRRRGATSW